MTASSSPRKHLVLACLSIVSTLSILALFVLCCWSAAADAQGAVAFFFAAPILGIGLAISIILGWVARPWRGGEVALRMASALAVLIAFFYVAAFVPPLRFFSDGVIRLVADGYELVTGKTPFAADKHL